MKKVLYAVGLISLPFIYVASVRLSGDPIDWKVIALMFVIISPLLFWKKINKMEEQFNSLSDKDKLSTIGRVMKKVLGRIAGLDD